jgi:uncharacterized protein
MTKSATVRGGHLASVDLLSGKTWGFPEQHVEHIETHAAHVFLCGHYAFKMKKNVNLPYLDFSTVEKRRKVLAREFQINKSFAPQLYLSVIEIAGEPVLKMKRFPATSLLSWRVDHDGVSDTLASELAVTLVETHQHAEQSTVKGADIMKGLGLQLAEAFKKSSDCFPTKRTASFVSLCSNALKRVERILNQRSSNGLVRRCHGDAHCGNIVIIDGKPILFDAIEFSEKIGTIDVLYDLSFLLMDLLHHNQSRAANIILNRYLHLRRLNEDLSGLVAMPLFLATRAGVRALVTADLAHELSKSEVKEQLERASNYFDEGHHFLIPSSPRLICIGGLSGTGKSTLATGLAPWVGAPPGAFHIRTDVERKVLAGVGETEHLRPEFYLPDYSGRVYAGVIARAKAALQTGHSVIIDGVFAREEERNAVVCFAFEMRVKFLGLWLDAKPNLMKERVKHRIGDASDATPQVIDAQLKYELGKIEWQHVDASGTIAEVYDFARGLISIKGDRR